MRGKKKGGAITRDEAAAENYDGSGGFGMQNSIQFNLMEGCYDQLCNEMKK